MQLTSRRQPEPRNPDKWWKDTELFYEWINEELKKRQWTWHELTVRGSVAGAELWLTFVGIWPLDEEFCQAISRALNIPPEIVYEKAKYSSHNYLRP